MRIGDEGGVVKWERRDGEDFLFVTVPMQMLWRVG